MKKTLFVLLAAAALAGCAKEEIVTVNQEAIAFNNAFVDNATKAIDPSITTATLDGFTVYGTTQGNEAGAPVVNIYPGVAVTGSVSGTWSYDDQYTQYWIADNTYNFAAVKNGAVTTDANGMPSSLAYDASTQTDLLYAEASATGKASSNEAVAFTFSHLLSKVKFSFQNTSAASTNANYTYKVTDITISGVGLTASCDITNYPTSYVWGTPATSYTEVAPLTFGHIVENGTAAGDAAFKVGRQVTKSSNYDRLLIPGDYKGINVKARIALLYGENEVDVINYNETVEVNLVGGNAYNFLLQASIGEPIEFKVTEVNGWIPNATQYTQYNNQ